MSPLQGIALSVLLLAAAASTVALSLDLGADFAVKAAAAFAAAGGIVYLGARFAASAVEFGIANVLTMTRVVLTALLAALVGEGTAEELLWFAVILAATALVLDGLDGSLARRLGETSPFGARFDMEADAALILVMSVLVWQLDRAGVWVLLAGAMRYAFVAASALLPWMRRALPPSRRRQTACVVAGVTLVVCLAPIVPPWLAPLAALAALVCLMGSFLTDTIWLWRMRDRRVTKA